MAIPKSKSSQTGPKSDAGKKKSSTNSLQHGVSAMLNQSHTTYAIVQSYEAELLAHYPTEHPLVKLQIQRIAMTRAKLTQLYELEQAKMALLYKKFEENPKQVMESIKDADEFVSNITLNYLDKGKYEFPFDLQPIQIKQLATEAASLKKPVLTSDDLELCLPKLYRWLTTLNIGWLQGIEQDFDSLDLLKFCSEDFRLMFELNSPNHVNFIARIMRLENQNQVSKEPKEVWSKELRDFVVVSHEENPMKKPVTPEEIKKFLNYFIQFDEALDQVENLLERFKLQSEMVRSTLALPPEESDRLSRYQTTLERRLSTQIGELRVMLAK
jgi:hypothetical protein